MRIGDAFRFSLGALSSQHQRTGLTALGIAVGIATVVILTALGAGLRRFVLAEFTQFGTNVVMVTPGKTETLGFSPAIIGTVRPLTVEDAAAIARLPGVVAAMPVVMGNAEVEWGARRRRVSVYGVGPDMPEIWRFETGSGSFLPREDAATARPLAVLGHTALRELLEPGEDPLGATIRVGGYRFRVVGALREKGQFLGFDLDDAVFVPVARALEMFDREGVMEVDVLAPEGSRTDAIEADVHRLLVERHGREDFTITSQAAMLEVLASVLSIVTFAVGALGGISLVVGGVGILTIMTIAVRERTREIGLLKALGATRRSIVAIFLGEAAALAGLGGLGGLAAGHGLALLAGALVPALPVRPEALHALVAEGSAVAIGLAAGVVPAIRAASLPPVDALRAE